MMKIDPSFVTTLRRWATLAGNLTAVTLDMTATIAQWATIERQIIATLGGGWFTWADSCKLTDAGILYANARAEELKGLLEESDRLMSPLRDPLKMTLGLNRWLDGDREEAYSDWLAWVLVELASPERIGLVFYGDSIPPKLLACKGRCAADREVWVPTGHANHAGRLDCVLRFEGEGIIVIEVKVIGAESADTVKQAGYMEWLDQQQVWFHNKQEGFRDAILLATSGDKRKDYEKFKLVLWKDFCKRLRKLLPEIINEGHIIEASLMAGLISAVEQNLLNLPSLSWMDRGSKVHVLELLDHLEKTTKYLRNTFSK